MGDHNIVGNQSDKALLHRVVAASAAIDNAIAAETRRWTVFKSKWGEKLHTDAKEQFPLETSYNL